MAQPPANARVNNARVNKVYPVLITALVIALGALYIWKLIDDHQHQNQLAEAQSRATQAAQQNLDRQGTNLLRVSVISLAWAARNNLMNANLPEINSYFNELIRIPGVRQITLARSNGTIAVSTNKKLEGQPLSRYFPAALLQQNEASVTPDGKGDMQAVSPIFGLNQKLGVLIISYTPEALQAPAAK